MKIFVQLHRLTYWPPGGSAIIYTAPGLAINVRRIIEEMDPDEFKRGCDARGNFLIPINVSQLRIVPGSDNGPGEGALFTQPDPTLEYPGPYGSFDLDLDKFYERCKQECIPVVISVYDSYDQET